mgnify:FL=1
MKKICLTLSLLLAFLDVFAQEITYKEVKNVPYSSSEESYAKERCKLDIY